MLSNTLRYYLLLALPALVGLALLGPRIVTYLASAQIAAAGRNLIPFLGLGLLLASLQNVFAIVLQLVEETRPLALARVLSASVYVLMVLLAVPRWGLFGGAVATALGYALDAGLSFLLAWRRLKFRLPGSSTAKALLASGLMIPVVLMLDSGSLSGLALAVAGGIMIYSTLLVVLRAVGRKELAFVQMILSSPSSFSQEA